MMGFVVSLELPEIDPGEFAGASPFPHVAVDGVLGGESLELLDAFPDADWPGWQRYGDKYQPNKAICSDIEAIPGPLRELVEQMHAPSFLGWLEVLTGIPSLIPDPYLEGGGLHSSGEGGCLTPHTDFHTYPRLDVYRRVNVILYLNPGWSEGDGGCLELYERGNDVPVRRIIPEWGRIVVFQTDDRSVHGFPVPIRPGCRRRSIALYYYTSRDARGFSGDTNTYWQDHGSQRGVRQVRLRLYAGLLFVSRAFSWLAHRVNPNLGSRVRAR